MGARRRRDDARDADDDVVDRDDDDAVTSDDDDARSDGVDSDDELEREMAALESVKRERAGARGGDAAGKSYVNNERGLEASLEGARRRAAMRGDAKDGTGRRRAAGLREGRERED
jgi:hypothetical protein